MFIKKSGFTLIELSIVLLILFLITGGIIGGSKLISNAKLQNLIKEIVSYQNQLVVFKNTYRYLPGNMPNATDYHPNVVDGNGNLSYSQPNGTATKRTENFRIFDHLNAFGFNDFKPTTSTGTTVNIGKTVPLSNSFKLVGFSFYSIFYGTSVISNPNEFDNDYNNVMVVGKERFNSYSINPFLTGSQALKIDTKMDNGDPTTGKIYSVKKDSALANECTTSNDLSTAEYNLSKGDEEICFVGYRKVDEW